MGDPCEPSPAREAVRPEFLASDALLQTLEGLPAYVCRFDAEFRLQYVNEEYCRLFDLPRESLLGRAFVTFLPENERVSVIAHLQTLSRDRPVVSHEMAVSYPPPGSPTILQWTTRAEFNEAGEIVTYSAVGVDVTHRQETRLPQPARSVADPPLELYFVLDRAYAVQLQSSLSLMTEGLSEGFSLRDYLGADAFDSLLKPLIDQAFAGQPVKEDVVLTIPGQSPRLFCADVSALSRGSETWVLLRLAERNFPRSLEGSIGHQQRTVRVMLDTLGALVVFLDTLGRVVLWNDACERTSGYRLEEVRDRPLWETLIVPEEAEAVKAVFRELAADGRPSRFENAWRHRSGELRWISWSNSIIRSASGRIAYVLGTGIDTTEAKHAQRSLQESERRFRTVLEQAADGILLFDALGHIHEANAAACNMLGYSREGLLSRRLWHLDPELQGLSEIARLLAQLQEAPITREGVQLTSDGRKIPVEMRLSLFRETPPLMLALVRDIAERKAAQALERQLQDKLLQAQKQESLALMAGGIAHDFNNLLMVILGSTECASEDVSTSSSAYEHLRTVRGAVQRAARLCEQMLSFSGKGHYQTVDLDLSNELAALELEFRDTIPQGVLFRVALEPGLPPVRADRRQLLQAVRQLISNACEAVSPEKGAISLRTGIIRCRAGELTDIPGTEPLGAGVYVFVDVSDNGPGMDRFVLQRAFDPFFTTKFTGRGLGLPAVMGFVRAHRGAIRLLSEPGTGTTVRLLLPESPVPSRREPVHIARARDRSRVLLVDDEESLRRLGRRLLEKMGYEVLVASTGNEAVRLFRSHQDEIICVVLDYSLPDLEGDQVFLELKKERPETPVIFMSGYGLPQVAARIGSDRVEGFLQKPFMSNQLREAIQKVTETGQ